jgi:hypothetical protein
MIASPQQNGSNSTKPSSSASQSPKNLADYIHVKLALLGFPSGAGGGTGLDGILSSLVAQYREKERLLANHLCPADHRIQTFLYDYLQEWPVPRMPLRTFLLDAPEWPVCSRFLRGETSLLPAT